MTQPKNQILFASPTDTEACVRVIGQGTCQISPAFKCLLAELHDKGFGSVIIDLDQCPMVDSTFIGVLAKSADLFKSSDSPCALVLHHANNRVSRSITSLGVDSLFTFSVADNDSLPQDAAFSEFVRQNHNPANQKSDVCQTSIEAHSALSDMNEENKKKFQHVLDFLKDDLKSD